MILTLTISHRYYHIPCFYFDSKLNCRLFIDITVYTIIDITEPCSYVHILKQIMLMYKMSFAKAFSLEMATILR